MDIARARAAVETMSPNNRWLFQHIIISFWHTFGISNGLRIPRTKVRLGNERWWTKDDCIEIPRETMQEILAQWQAWLTSYATSWDTERFNDTSEAMLSLDEDCHESWNRVRDALLLIQVCLAATQKEEQVHG